MSRAPCGVCRRRFLDRATRPARPTAAAPRMLDFSLIPSLEAEIEAFTGRPISSPSSVAHRHRRTASNKPTQHAGAGPRGPKRESAEHHMDARRFPEGKEASTASQLSRSFSARRHEPREGPIPARPTSTTLLLRRKSDRQWSFHPNCYIGVTPCHLCRNRAPRLSDPEIHPLAAGELSPSGAIPCRWERTLAPAGRISSGQTCCILNPHPFILASFRLSLTPTACRARPCHPCPFILHPSSFILHPEP